MKIYLDPEILFLRTSAKLGGVPFQIAFTIAERKDTLILEGGDHGFQMMARRPGQSAQEFRAWAVSEYSDLDPTDVLVKVRTSIRHIEVAVRENGRLRKVKEFDKWVQFIDWLGDAEETEMARYTVVIPLSLYKAVMKMAEKRRAAGGRGTLREVVLAALEEYLERYS